MKTDPDTPAQDHVGNVARKFADIHADITESELALAVHQLKHEGKIRSVRARNRAKRKAKQKARC